MTRIGGRSLTLAALLIIVVGLSSPLEALQGQGKPDNKAKSEKNKGQKDSDVTQEVVVLVAAGIASQEAHRWASEFSLTGQKALPPGIAKNLARGKPIPPGIAKRDLPSTFLKKLPNHKGYEWHAAGWDLLLVRTADKVVSEILKDVFK